MGVNAQHQVDRIRASLAPDRLAWRPAVAHLPVLGFELHERATRHNGLLAKSAMGAVLLAASVVTAIGSMGAYVSMWRPVL